VAILGKTMQREEIIIGDCSSCRPLEGEIDSYKTEIIARRSLWKDNLETNYALEQSPYVGHTYYVFLKQPIRFRLYSKFWLIYQCPKVFYDGYEKEEEFEKTKFCYGQITKVNSYDKTGAAINFTVLKTKSLQDILETDEARDMPVFLADIFIQSLINKDYDLRIIGKYSQLSTSFAQGDIGHFCIYTQHEDVYTICLYGEWFLNEDWIFGVKYILPESVRKVIMIKP
jgi:hypothetical protein